MGGPSPALPPLPVCAPKFKNNLPPFESANNPGDIIWKTFPFNPLPSSPTSVINWKAFQAAIDSVSSALTPTQRELADLIISDLKFGANTLVDLSRVPLKIVPNNSMPAELAAACADQLATMIKLRHISGPVFNPTLPAISCQPSVHHRAQRQTAANPEPIGSRRYLL